MRDPKKPSKRIPAGLRPDRNRKFSPDLIPEGAYWREPTGPESKIDFELMEAQEGRSLTGGRIRLGIILAAQMEAYVEWARSDRFTAASLRKVPLFLADEVGDEFARLFARSFWDGSFQYQDMMRRRDAAEGRPPRDPAPIATLTADGTRQLLENARRLAVDVCRGIAMRLAPALESSFAPDGRRVKTPDQIEGEIRAIYTGPGGYIEEGPKDLEGVDLLELSASIIPEVLDSDGILGSRSMEELTGPPFSTSRGGGRVGLDLSSRIDSIRELLILLASRKPISRKTSSGKTRRPMKVRDPKAFERWQRERVPFSRWMKKTAEEMRREGRRTVQIKKDKAARWLQTERTRYYAQGVLSSAQTDPEVGLLTYTAIRDGRTCDVCLGFDGVTLRKTDPRWAMMTPPMHHSCRCSLVPVTKKEATQYRIRPTGAAEMKDLPWDDIAPGFGTYNPKAIKSARRLGIVPPKGRAQNRAIGEATGGEKRQGGSRRSKTEGGGLPPLPPL